MLVVAYGVAEGHAVDLDLLVVPRAIEVGAGLDDELLLAKAYRDVEGHLLHLITSRTADAYMPSVLVGHFPGGGIIQAVEEAHREGSSIVELDGAQTLIDTVEDIGIDRMDGTLEDATGGELELLVLHVEARGIAHHAHHVRIQHRTLRSLTDQHLDGGLIGVGHARIAVHAEDTEGRDTDDVDRPVAKQVEEDVNQVEVHSLRLVGRG